MPLLRCLCLFSIFSLLWVCFRGLPPFVSRQLYLSSKQPHENAVRWRPWSNLNVWGFICTRKCCSHDTRARPVCSWPCPKKRARARERAREGYGAPVTPRVFIQGCLSHPCLSKSRKIKKKTPSTKGQGRNLKSAVKPSLTSTQKLVSSHIWQIVAQVV